MLELRPLSLRVNTPEGIFEFSGMDFVRLAIEVMKEIEQEILAQGDALKPEGDGSMSNPYIPKSSEQWLYAALEIDPEKKQKSYWRIGNKIILCFEKNRYFADLGDPDEMHNQIIAFTKYINLPLQTQQYISNSLYLDRSKYAKGFNFILLAKCTSIFFKQLKNNLRTLEHETFNFQSVCASTVRKLQNKMERENYGRDAKSSISLEEELANAISKFISGVNGKKPTGPTYKELREAFLNCYSGTFNEYIAEFVSYILDAPKNYKSAPLYNKPVPLLTAILFLAEAGRNPVSFLAHKILIKLIQSNLKGSHFLKNLNIATLLWYEKDSQFKDMYGTEYLDEKKPPRDSGLPDISTGKIGGLGPMEHDGSFLEFENNKYQLTPPFSIARQKESLILTEWLCIVLGKKYGPDKVKIIEKEFLDKNDPKGFSFFDLKNPANAEGAKLLKKVIKPMMRNMIFSPQLPPTLKNNTSQPDVLSSITMNRLFSLPRTRNSGNQTQPDVLSPITMRRLFSSPRASDSGNQNPAQSLSLLANKK